MHHAQQAESKASDAHTMLAAPCHAAHKKLMSLIQTWTGLQTPVYSALAMPLGLHKACAQFQVVCEQSFVHIHDRHRTGAGPSYND